METMFKQLSLLMALLNLHLQAGQSELTVKPHDTEVLVNHSTYFNCSTSILSEQIYWYHYRVGDNRTNYVYHESQFNQTYADRYSVAIDTTTGQYNLNIRSVQPEDAGRYECQDDGGLGSQSSAELIVLDSMPMCMSNMKPVGHVGPTSCVGLLPIDELNLSCIILYSGNILPELQWKMDGDDTPISSGISTYYSKDSVTVNLTMSPDAKINGHSFICGTTRSQYDCATDQMKVQDAIVDDPMILNTTKGENITCSANATLPCTYRWFYGNDSLSPASHGQVLTTNRLGNYRCEANCTINGISCTFVSMRILVIEVDASSSEDQTKTLLLAILIPLLVILLIVVIFVIFFVIRKAMIENREPNVVNIELAKISGIQQEANFKIEMRRLLTEIVINRDLLLIAT